MAQLNKNRTVQYELTAEFVFGLTDTFVMTDGVARAFGAAGAATLAEVIALPVNAVVVGGDLTVEVASNDSGTATVSVGDSASAARYLAATSLKTAGRTALVPTGYRGNGEDIRLTFANANGNATQGTVSLRVKYIVTGRANEVQYA